MKGMLIMYGNHGKKVGFVISAIGLLGIAIERLRPWLFIRKLDVTQHLAIFQWITLAGLLTIAFSKEKYDDDRAQAIRLKSLQLAFILEQAVVLAVGLTCSIAKEALDASVCFTVGAMGTIMYLLLFHVGLYFDFLWDYDDSSLKGYENVSRILRGFKRIEKNKWSFLVYLLLSAILMLSLTLFE